MTSCAWLWIYAGLALALLELVTPGFVLCFFGFAAATVGAMRLAMGDAFDATWQLAAFSVLSILYIVVLRRALKKVFVGDRGEGPAGLPDEFVGRVGRVTEAIEPPKAGRVLLGDAEWSAESDAAVPAGADVRVVSRSNLTVKVVAV